MLTAFPGWNMTSEGGGECSAGRGSSDFFFFLAKFITDTQPNTQGKTELCFDF